jgi:hypothetical protein
MYSDSGEEKEKEKVDEVICKFESKELFIQSSQK